MEESIRKLITTLEGRAAGDPQLSKAVLLALGWDWERMGCPGGGIWKKPEASYHCGSLPVVTEVAESARALIPGGLFVAAEPLHSTGWRIAVFDRPLATPEDYRDPVATAAAGTLTLALCSAALKIRLRTYSSSSAGVEPR